MMPLRWLLALLVAVVAVRSDAITTKPLSAATASPSTILPGTVIPPPDLEPPQRSHRVRKSWSRYTRQEKSHYLGAVRKAMRSGKHFVFVQIHAERMNKLTAHQTCGFLLWHRRFLLGYENMLRTMGPTYADITLPYWNYFEDATKQLATNVPCDSLQSCSSFLRDMGGGGTSDLIIGESQVIGNTTVIRGSCVSKGIAAYACADRRGEASGNCAHCLLRGAWAAPNKVLETLGPDLLSMVQVFHDDEDASGSTDDDHAQLGDAIENSYHAAVHNNLRSTMKTMASVFDPVFMGHHAMIDLSQFIFNRCRYDPNDRFNVEKDPRDTAFDVFAQCDVVDENDQLVGIITANDTIQMTLDGVPVEEAAETRAYFISVGTRYKDFANAEALTGGNSYRYEVDAYLENLLQTHQVECPSYMYSSPTSRRLDATVDAAQEMAATLAQCGREVQRSHPSLTFKQRVEQEGLLKCLVVRERSGGVLEDYTDDFRSEFMLRAGQKPYCLELLDRMESDQLPLLASDTCKQRYGKLTGIDLVKYTTTT